VGGAIANDVHGKNHHSYGTFGDHVRRLTLVRSDGQVIECGPDDKADWFSATVGGLGLTGIITEAQIQLQRVDGPWIDAEDVVFQTLGEFFTLSDESDKTWQHSVSWVDCTTDGGRRGIFSRGNPAVGVDKKQPSTRELTVPVTPPFSLVNRLTLSPFNVAYFTLKRLRAGRGLIHYRPFFYPLDAIHEWNRIYGPRGFFQYQSVVPRHDGEAVTQEMLKEIAASGTGSFLGVLKTFGDRAPVGMLSFPQPGVTLALDFPNLGEKTEKLFRRLDGIVTEAGGRLYPAKDARMSREMFEEGYPRLAEFAAYRDPGISSEQSRRLMGH